MNKLDVLKDVLEDFLEIRAFLSGRTSRPIKEFLFSRPLRRYEIHPLEGFSLDGNLVLLENGGPDPVENLVFLRPREGAIQVSRINRK